MQSYIIDINFKWIPETNTVDCLCLVEVDLKYSKAKHTRQHHGPQRACEEPQEMGLALQVKAESHRKASHQSILDLH